MILFKMNHLICWHYLYSLRIHEICKVYRKQQLTSINFWNLRYYLWVKWRLKQIFRLCICFFSKWLKRFSSVNIGLLFIRVVSSFSCQYFRICNHIIKLILIKSWIIFFNFFDIHYIVKNISFVHSNCTKVADQTIIFPHLIKLL